MAMTLLFNQNGTPEWVVKTPHGGDDGLPPFFASYSILCLLLLLLHSQVNTPSQTLCTSTKRGFRSIIPSYVNFTLTARSTIYKWGSSLMQHYTQHFSPYHCMCVYKIDASGNDVLPSRRCQMPHNGV